MDPMMIVLFVIVAIALIIVIWAISINNAVKRAGLKCDEAMSGIDVALEKRHDMLTKLLAAAKKYQDYEKATVLETIKLRADAPIAQKVKDANKMDQAQNVLFGLAENYPDLKASANWETLQSGIMDAEEHLQASRRAYNAAATQYNNYHVTFPSNLIANRIKPDKREYFEAEAGKKEDVKID
ncbi:MAG: LemA family protein [Coriobacteriales bacterium]|nr:LemA family protein [Coriobacteriales bacterium]